MQDGLRIADGHSQILTLPALPLLPIMAQPITVWITPADPNSWKVLIILVELGLPYSINMTTTSENREMHVNGVPVNNDLIGRVPVIYDPNTNLTVWDSNDIVLYLEDTYDKGCNLTHKSINEKLLLKHWLQFQISEDNPYFTQFEWFQMMNPEWIPASTQEYQEEVCAVLDVLNSHLANNPWLVGEKCTFADLSFLPWGSQVDTSFSTSGDPLALWPHFQRWQSKMKERGSWKDVAAIRSKLLGQAGLPRGIRRPCIRTIQEYEVFVAREVSAMTEAGY